MDRERKSRLVPGWPGLVLLAPPLLFIFYLQFTDGLGDEGMNNGITYFLLLVAAAIYGLWFLLASGQPARRRLGVLAGVAVVAVAARLIVRIDSWSGAIVPELRWAWSERPPELDASELAPEAGVDLAATTADDFPGFLGRRRDGHVRGTTLARDWSTTPPEVLWRVPVGAGWSGFAVVNGVAVTQEQRGGEQVVVARDLDTGAELWRHAHAGRFEHALAGEGPRATPLVHGGLVYAHDVLGKLECLDGRDGSLVWERDLKADYGMTDELEAELVQFGRSPSPIVHGDLVLVPAGGDPEGQRAGLVALDRLTGETRWEGPPRHFSHASPNVITLAGVQQAVVTNEDTASGHDLADGSLLWEHPWPGATSAAANNSQPTLVGDDHVLLSKGYGQGSTLLRVTRGAEGAFAVEEVWASRRALRTKLTNPVVHGEHAYGLSDGILECVALADGERVWREGRYGHGQVLLVGEGAAAVLLVLTEEGELVMVEPTPAGEGRVLGRADALDGLTWNTFALYGDRLLVRNGEVAACLRLPVREV